MTTTVLGQIARSEGRFDTDDGPAIRPAAAFVVDQPPDLPVHLAHATDWTLGRVGYLERSDRHGLLAVATVSDDAGDLLADGDWYFSDSMVATRLGRSAYRGHAVMDELSLVRATGNVGTRPVVAVPGDIARGTTAAPRSIPLGWDATWERAAEHMAGARYRCDKHTTIFDVDPLDELGQAFADPALITRAATLKRMAATPPVSPAPSVRLHGRLLSAEDAAKFREFADFGYVDV